MSHNVGCAGWHGGATGGAFARQYCCCHGRRLHHRCLSPAAPPQLCAPLFSANQYAVSSMLISFVSRSSSASLKMRSPTGPRSGDQMGVLSICRQTCVSNLLREKLVQNTQTQTDHPREALCLPPCCQGAGLLAQGRGQAAVAVCPRLAPHSSQTEHTSMNSCSASSPQMSSGSGIPSMTYSSRLPVMRATTAVRGRPWLSACCCPCVALLLWLQSLLAARPGTASREQHTWCQQLGLCRRGSTGCRQRTAAADVVRNPSATTHQQLERGR